MVFKVFIIAGESSGDWLGAKVLREIRKQRPDAEVQGIGGKKLKAEGLESLFPMEEISLMGFAEIVPHLPNLMKRMKQTEKAIREFKPDILLTIDSPGFNFRIAKNLQDMRDLTKFVHYVAPTVWAYKPERAEKIAKLYDHLLVILPFEPQYFEREGLRTTFVGHPSIEDGLDKGLAQTFMDRHGLNNDFICLMPGSRAGELKRILPVFEKVVEYFAKPVVIIAADNARDVLLDYASRWKTRVVIVDNKEKADCFAACAAGIIKSGTSGLEFAFANKPYVVAYKVLPITAWLVRRMVKIPFANLLNILAGKELVRELLQENCTSEQIILALEEAIHFADMDEYEATLNKLRPAEGTPSANAAHKILELAGAI